MSTEEFNKALSEIPDKELRIRCKDQLSNLCRSGGKSFTMTVPPEITDTDMLLLELLLRFDRYSTNRF
jgi:hypothetical protein